MQTFVGSLIIIVSTIVIRVTGFEQIDPLPGMAFGLVLFVASWSITSGRNMFSRHILVEDYASDGQRILRQASRRLKEDYGMYCSTLQIEDGNRGGCGRYRHYGAGVTSGFVPRSVRPPRLTAPGAGTRTLLCLATSIPTRAYRAGDAGAALCQQ